VPLWCLDFEYVPSLHFAVAPVGSVLPSAAAGADFVAVDDRAIVVEGAGLEGVAAGVGVAAGAGSAVAAVAGLALVAFCIPPWPLQVPLPVDVLVVPSLQVVVGGSAAKLGMANANTSRGAAMKLAIVVFFIKNSRVKLRSFGL
jgi:hypothetical protein